MMKSRPDNTPCDHWDSKELFHFKTVRLTRCDACGVIFSSCCRDAVDPSSLYDTYYRNETAGRFSFGVEYLIRLFRFFRAFKIFSVSPRAKRILDIGSGRGFTLYYLRKYYRYARTAGTQISKNAFEFSRDKLGLEIYQKDLLKLSLKNASFDVVTIWHVLEHVHQPERYIQKIADLLDVRGRLILEVPNYNSWTRILTGRYWLSFDLKHHLFFFTPEALSFMLRKHGFKIRRIHTFSLEYSAFTSAQSLVNLLTGSDSIFFESLQTGKLQPRTLAHAFLIMLFMPLCLLINLLLYFSKRGEVLFMVAEKKIP